VHADVAERRGAEQRVAYGVQQHVGVGMAGEAFFVRNLDAADDQLAAGDERMHIESLSYSHFINRQAHPNPV